MSDSPYPLSWPQSKPRTPPLARKRATFGKAAAGKSYKEALTVSVALDRVLGEVDRLGGNYAVISSNVAVRLDGKPRSGQPEPADPGVALYFVLGGKPVCMPCDRYDRVADNIAAIAAHIEATRAIERHGVGTAAEALMAFTALPAPGAKRPWWDVLGVPKTASRAHVDVVYRQLAKQAHPDTGGSADAMSDLNAARDAALKDLGA